MLEVEHPTVYLASPRNQMSAHAVRDMPVLLSFTTWADYLEQYQQTFSQILIDSGAFSVMNTGQKVEVSAYRDWADRWVNRADAIAGLDDIEGDWRKSMKAYEQIPYSFGTFHDTDPPELLEDLIAMARERTRWIGVGLLPPREGKGDWVRNTVERIPKDIHVHVWAGRRFLNVHRINSADSTNWFRDAMKLRAETGLKFLTLAECVDLIVLRYKRESKQIRPAHPNANQIEMWEEA